MGGPETTPFFEAIKDRRSLYQLKPESPISADRIIEIVNFAVKHTPSSFNVQAARAVVLFGDDHKKLWEIGAGVMRSAVPEQVWEGFLKKRTENFQNGAYGTVMFFEDQDALEELAKKNPMVQPLIQQFSEQSTGMHHFVVWTALETEGLGANLQHYNFPEIGKQVSEHWKLPNTWLPKAQLVFGTPVTRDRDHERTYEPLEKRVHVFGKAA